MRKIIVSNIASLDGYYEGKNKDVMALFDFRRAAYPEDESFDLYNAERLRSADSLLLGASTYAMFKGYWPRAGDAPGASAATKEIARLNNSIEKIVVSDSLREGNDPDWENTTIIGRASATRHIRELKNKAGKDILVFGSRRLWNGLLREKLVDELHLMIAPVLLGSGTPLFEEKPEAELRLIDSASGKGSGIVLIRYAIQY